MGPLLALGILVAWWVSRSSGKSGAPPEVVHAVANSATMEPAAIDAAAKAADAAALPKTATALREKADVARELAGAQSSQLPAAMPSPLPPDAVPQGAWLRFVAWAKRGRVDTITASYLMGYFLTGARTLGDLGMMRNVKLQAHPKGGRYWAGEWVEPFTQADFMTNGNLQYLAFKKHALILWRAVLDKHFDVLGKDVGVIGAEGKPLPATMSGLMAVARVAGLGGLDKWLADPAKRHADTTAAYKAANGIF